MSWAIAEAMARPDDALLAWFARRNAASLELFGKPVYRLDGEQWERLRSEVGPPPDKDSGGRFLVAQARRHKLSDPRRPWNRARRNGGQPCD